jgi:uncharacterized protein (TIGR00730 family)
MNGFAAPEAIDTLRLRVNQLLDRLPDTANGQLMLSALDTLVNVADSEVERLDWKILSASLQDMEAAFKAFYPHRHTRKIAIFGSARIGEDTPEYALAREFARAVTGQGFMVITGAGGGIMQAGNEGAGANQSFGLNIQLPFEQGANSFMTNADRVVSFKYFFTRKLFFLKESDALALFPGGFGTQDEAFECITLSQTGKSVPLPMVLIDVPGGSYWRDWAAYIDKNLLGRGLISPEDPSLYTITDRVDVACAVINQFYRVYHSSRYVGEQLVIRLKSALCDEDLVQLNQDFGDILVDGKISKSAALAAEAQDEDHDQTVLLPRLVLQFNQRDLGRLYQLIGAINQLGDPNCGDLTHPERK